MLCDKLYYAGDAMHPAEMGGSGLWAQDYKCDMSCDMSWQCHGNGGTSLSGCFLSSEMPQLVR